MLDYKFKSKLITTNQLLKELNITLACLDFWKTQWRKKGKDDWDMGLRLIGTKAFWDPVIFTKWLFEHKCKNKPTNNTEQLLSLIHI